MKKIFVIVLLLFCITPLVFAKEYKADIANTVLTFSIPDSYDIIDINHPDPAVLQKLGMTAEEAVQEMKAERVVLDCLDIEAGNEICFICISSATTKRYGDLKNRKDAINSPDFKEAFLRSFSTSESEVTNVHTREFPNAIYIVWQGNSRELNEDGKYTYLKVFSTVKDGALFIIKGISWTGEHSKLDSSLETIINNMNFTTSKGTVADANSNVSTNVNKSASTSVTEKAAYRGGTKGLAAAVLVGICMVVSWIYRKIKEKKNSADNDVIVNPGAANNVPINDKQQVDIQRLAQDSGGAAKNDAAATDMTKTDNLNPQSQLNIENLRELKKLLDDGIITQEDFDAAKKKILV